MAGIAATRKTAVGNFAVLTLEDDDWDMIMKTNLDGVKNCLRAQLQAMTGAGSIVNAASTGGQMGAANCSPYVVSKWGVIGLSKSAAKEVGKKGIRINCVAPYDSPLTKLQMDFLTIIRGVIATPLTNTPSTTRDAFLATTALGRIGQPEEVARGILWMLSDESSFMTASVSPPPLYSCLAKLLSGCKYRRRFLLETREKSRGLRKASRCHCFQLTTI